MSSSLSSSTSQEKKYGVFLNFRGEDVRCGFLSHLYKALTDAGINTYIDDRLERGTELEPELLQAIKDSRISIVIFSEKYTNSSWCLKELEQIMECRINCGQLVMPIFYKVDPSKVRSQSYRYKNAVQGRSSAAEMMENEYSNWGHVLTKAANISGWHDKNYKTEAELVSKIVDNVKKQLNNSLLNIIENPVGLKICVQQVNQFIGNQSSKVCFIGIWGMGGSGKTLIAKAIYNKLHCEFDNHSFIKNVRDVCSIGDGSDKGIEELQECILKELQKTDEKIFGNALKTIKQICKSKRVLIVLDDVSTVKQVEHLCGARNYFGPGSVLIVTSRDAHIFNSLKFDHVYNIKEMDKNNSLELFSWHAFKQASPLEDFKELSESIADYCGGLPLALEVIGSSLNGRGKKFWEKIPSYLKRVPNKEVQKRLKISFDGLDEKFERNIFLDICCFFIGKDRAYVTDILNGCGLYADNGIAVLIERSLLRVKNNNKLEMHDLLRDMGRKFVEESAKKLGKRSRLWFQEDVHDVLKENSGTTCVEGLVLKSQSNKKVFETDSFMGMKNLRLLQLDHVDLTGDYVHLSQELRWLCWPGFKDDCIPDNFCQLKLVAFELEHSNIKHVWNETKSMQDLKILNLSYSKHLTHTPDFSKLPNLEKLIMNDCSSLSQLHHSIGDLKKILLINLKDCTSLSNLPEEVYQLASLETLILSGCSNIDQLEGDMEQMKPWTNGTGVKEILYSIQGLKTITYENRNVNNTRIELSFEVFPTAKWSRTVKPRIFLIDNLYDINFREPETSQNSNLSLRSLLIGTGSCQIVIDTLSKSISQGFTSNDSSHFSLAGDNSSWLAYTSKGPSVRFKVPENIDCHEMAICVAYSSTPENMRAECLTTVLIINYKKSTVHIYKRDTLNYEDWKGLTSNLEPHDDVEIFVDFRHGLIVKQTAIYLIYGQSTTTEFEKSIIIKEVEPSTNMNIDIPENRLEDHIPPAPPAPPLSPEGNESVIQVFEQSFTEETTVVEVELSKPASLILEHEASTVGYTEVGSSSTAPPPAFVTQEAFDSYVASNNAINEANTKQVETIIATQLQMQQTLQLILEKLTKL